MSCFMNSKQAFLPRDILSEYICRNWIKILLFVSLSGFTGCNDQRPKENKKVISAAVKIEASKKTASSKHNRTADTLTITTETGDTLKFLKDTLNQIINNHPEFTDDFVENPDLDYHCHGQGFGGEVGQDDYFILYAYFLKNKNGEAKYSERRKKLINIYLNINSLFRHFEYGGTYFGHQSARILGYAEYAIYLYKQNEAYPKSKTYDITKQKELYIRSLRQLISDESKIDFESLGNEKIMRTKKLNKIVDDIDKAITDNYYLRRTQDFHYQYYEYD